MSRVEKFTQDFHALDANGDGGITWDEYQMAFNASSSVSDPRLAAMQATLLDSLRKEFDTLDANGDGRVTLEEYLNLRLEQAAASDDLKAFLALDRDGRGCLLLADVRGPYTPGSKEAEAHRRIGEALPRYDADRDGRVWLEEFLDGRRKDRAGVK